MTMDHSPPTQAITGDEFEAFLALPENSDHLFELIEGEIVEKMPTELHNMISGTFYYVLRTFVKEHDLGRVTYETRVRASKDDKKNDRLPDIGFTRKARLLPIVRQGAVPQLPDLCVEIQSPSNYPRQMRKKAEYYLENGSTRVWLVYTDKEIVEVMSPGGEFNLLVKGDTLTDDELLPGFALPVADIFNLENE
jgi:Uma2 family endonuclease